MPLKAPSAADSADLNAREDWANYCSEMAVASLFGGELAEAVSQAEKAAESWGKLSEAWPTHDFYKTRLGQSRIALAAFQLLYRQSSAAVETMKRGLGSGSGRAVEFKGMLALAYLLEGQNEKAWALLIENRLVGCGPMQTFGEAVLEDLRRFREKGLTTVDLAAVEQLLASGK
jgi:hypothetical protein